MLISANRIRNPWLARPPAGQFVEYARGDVFARADDELNGMTFRQVACPSMHFARLEAAQVLQFGRQVFGEANR